MGASKSLWCFSYDALPPCGPVNKGILRMLPIWRAVCGEKTATDSTAGWGEKNNHEKNKLVLKRSVSLGGAGSGTARLLHGPQSGPLQDASKIPDKLSVAPAVTLTVCLPTNYSFSKSYTDQAATVKSEWKEETETKKSQQLWPASK